MTEPETREDRIQKVKEELRKIEFRLRVCEGTINSLEGQRRYLFELWNDARLKLEEEANP